MKLKFTGANNKALSMQGWSASHDSSDPTAYAPLHADGKVVALVVVRGGDEDQVERVIELGRRIEQASNVHSQLVAALKAAHSILPTGRELGLVEAALKAAGAL